MSGENNNGVMIDAKFFGVIIFLVTQLFVAVWWAGEKTTEIAHLQSDLNKLTDHMDKQLDRMESKIDALRNK
jgi:hypothetical protein